MRHEDVAAARHRLRHQQRLSVHHRPRGDAPVVAAARAARSRRAARRRSAARAGAVGQGRRVEVARRRRCARQRAVRRRSGGRRSRPSRNARHKGMLKVILGEMLEHKRLFDQAAAGNTRPDRHVARDQRSHAARSCAPAGWSRHRPRSPIALGSNLGDREAHLAFGLSAAPAVHHQPHAIHAGTTRRRSACRPISRAT